MNRLSAFFKASDTSLGTVFYPTHSYLLHFRRTIRLRRQFSQLRDAGFPEDEILAVNRSGGG